MKQPIVKRQIPHQKMLVEGLVLGWKNVATKDEGAHTSILMPHHICTILQRQSLIEQQKRNKGTREQQKIVMVILPPLLFQWLDFYTVKVHYVVKRIQCRC